MSGLNQGASLVLSNNGSSQVTVTANGAFSFSASLPAAGAYDVTVSTQPTGQVCSVSHASGTVGTANVNSVSVVCTATTPSTAPTAVVGDANAVPLVLDGGRPLNAGAYMANAVYATIEICSPGGAQCAIIDHVIVDTGSTGLRLFASALNAINPSLLASLPQASTAAGAVTGECESFASGTTWGGVRNADLHWGGSNYAGETVANIPIQVIGDTDSRVSTIPASCSNQGVSQTARSMIANGIIGVGLTAKDCGASCALYAYPTYYQCDGTQCSPVTMPLANQVPNPVSAMSSDNNGSMILLPNLPTGGASSSSGLLILGISTRSNNQFDSASVVLGANGNRMFASNFNGNTLPYSFIDSGSSVNYLASTGTVPLTICTSSPNFICPGASITLTANNTGTQGTSGAANVLIVDAQLSFTDQPGYNAVPGLSYALSGTPSEMDLGASFFYGRVISTLIENQIAGGMAVTGPAFGYTP